MVEDGGKGSSLIVINESRGGIAVLDVLRSIPEEEIWLAGQLSPHTRRAYKQDVEHFIATMKLSDAADFRKVGRAAIVAWHTRMTAEGAKARTVRRRLSALSSLFAHLVEHRIV